MIFYNRYSNVSGYLQTIQTQNQRYASCQMVSGQQILVRYDSIISTNNITLTLNTDSQVAASVTCFR